jgi:hypothetical protein
MATPELSSKAPAPQIVRITLEKRDKDGKLIETKVVEFKDGNHR